MLAEILWRGADWPKHWDRYVLRLDLVVARRSASSCSCEDTRSPVGWHLDGRAKGFYVGVYRATLDADSAHVDCPDQFACAYSETAEPTAKAIGDLICDAPPNAAIHPAGWHE